MENSSMTFFIICEKKNVLIEKYGEKFLRILRFLHIINFFSLLLVTILSFYAINRNTDN